MTKLLQYFKPYRWIIVFSFVLILVELFADLIQPAMVADIVDIGIKNKDVDYIIKEGIAMIGVALVGIIGGIGSAIGAAYVSQSLSTDLRGDLFKKVQAFSFSNLDHFKTSSLITRLTNDITQIGNMIRISLRMMVRAFLLCIGGVIMAIQLNVVLSSVFLVAIPLLMVSFYIISKVGFPIFTKVQDKLDRVNNVMRENLAGVRVVKAFVRSDLEKKRFNKANIDLMEKTIKGSTIISFLTPILMLIMNLSIVAVLWFGGIQFGDGSITDGQIIAFINYLTRIMNALMRVAISMLIISRAKASTERINEVLDTEIDIKDLQNAEEIEIKDGKITFENVSFRYPKAKGEPVLKNISFTAEPGQSVAIIGATGSGKSTLVHLLPRLYDVTDGRILIDGKDIRSFKLKALRSQIGIVLQEAVLFSGTVKDNLRWGNSDANEEEIIKGAEAAQAHEFISTFAEGYETILGQRGVNISGGQKQRLSIGRALIRNPKILILDDSTSAVDLGTEARIQEALNKKKGSCTVLVIAQRITTVMNADKILVLDEGEIVGEGSHKELMATSPIYQDIYASQLGKEGAINA